VPTIFTHNDLDIIAHNKRVTGVTPWASQLRLWEVSVAK
jgi:peptide/nickel transport system substrate-binding protein